MSGLTQPNAYDAAGMSRLMSDWRINITDPQMDWSSEWRQIAARANDLVRNDPVVCALMEAMISGTHGNTGLRHRSLYAETGANETSDAEVAQRRLIDAEIEEASQARFLDASGMMTRWEWEESLDRMALVNGEGFAIRKFLSSRNGAPMATCWLMIQPYRVMNPPGKENSETLYEGIVLGDNGPEGIWIAPAMRGTSLTVQYGDTKGWTYVSWYAPDGSRNVIHRVGMRPPGGIRGVSELAPLMAFAKQTKGVIEAYVIAKRVQACHPIFIQVADPVAAAKADRNGAVWGNNTTVEPGKVYYVGLGSTVNFANWTFNGADMKEFLDTLYRNQFAAMGLPICVVLGQMSSGSNQAARSDWMQYYRACTRRQNRQIEQVTSVLDESIIRESVARKKITNPTGNWSKMMAGRYVRPARSMPDPLKEAQAVAAWIEVGRDLTSLYAEAGIDLKEAIMQRAEDDKLLEAQGVKIVTAQAQPIPTNPNDQPAPVEDQNPGAPKDKAA